MQNVIHWLQHINDIRYDPIYNVVGELETCYNFYFKSICLEIY